MKMKKITLTLALLTVTGTMSASLVNNMLASGPGMIPKNMIPSETMQKEAATLYKDVAALKVTKQVIQDGKTIEVPVPATIQLPADLATLIKNTLSVIPKTKKEATDLENLQIASIQIQFPYPGMTDQLTQLMGEDAEFMKALKEYQATFQAQQGLWNQLWQETSSRSSMFSFSGPNTDYILEMNVRNGNKTAAQQDLKQLMAPIFSAAQQTAAQETLTTLLASSKKLNTQLANLQTMFTNANGDHLTKINYLVTQNVQWMLAFGMAINPDFAKALTPETVKILAETVTNLHTSSKAVAVKKRLEIHAAKMMHH